MRSRLRARDEEAVVLRRPAPGRARRRAAGTGRGSSARSALSTSTTWLVGGDVVEVELADLLDVAEDGGQLGGHPLDLLVRQLEAGQPGDVEYLLAVDHGPRV